MKPAAVHSIRALEAVTHKDTSGVRTLCMTALTGLLLSTCLATPASADCPAAPLASADDMVVSFIASQGGTQAAPSTLFASTVKEGMLVYDDTGNALKLCDGTNWVALQAGAALAAGTVTGAVQFRGPTGLLSADDTNFIWDDTNNRLGIGTATANNTLEVHTATGNANIRVRANAGGAAELKLQASADDTSKDAILYLANTDFGSGDGFILKWDHDADKFVISDIGGTNRLVVDTEGHVGIGTVSPHASSVLDLTSTTLGFLPPRMTTTDVGNIATPADGLIVYDTTADTLKLRANGAWTDLAFGAGGGGSTAAAGNAGEIQFNNGSGALNADSNLFWDNTNKRLGVGTNTPDAKLDVAGMSPTEPGLLALANPPDGGAVDHLIAGYTIADRSLRITSERQGGGRNNFIMHNMHYDGATYTQENWGGSSMIQFSGGNILFFNDAEDTGGSNTAITPTARLVILQDGDVGIGVTAPDAKLEVAGGIKIGDDTDTCPGSGNVKLGTLRFNSGNFEVCQSGGWASASGGASGVGDAGYVQISDGSGGLTTSGNTAGQEFFWDNTNKRLGIGTTSPPQLLTVNSATGNANLLLSGGFTNGTSSIVVNTVGDASFGRLIFQKSGTTDGGITYAHGATAAARALSFDVAGGTPEMSILGSGNVGISTTNPHASALLDVSSTTKGFLPPRMTEGQRDAIASPATGLMIFNTTDGQHEFWNGSAWNALGGSVPTGIIAAFATTSCPTGWTEYTAARGRFLRGIDNGAGIDPSGTRTPGNAQGDASKIRMWSWMSNGSGGTSGFGIIAHKPAVEMIGIDLIGSGGWGSYNVRKEMTGAFDATYGNSSETRPKNVAVLFCQYAGGAPLVATPSGAAGAIQFADGSGGLTSDANIVVSGGNVGIGTTTPGSKLHVNGSGWFTSRSIPAAGSGAGVEIAYRNATYGGYIESYDRTGSAWIPLTLDSQKLLLNPSGGNVGIGTASPSAILHIAPAGGDAGGTRIKSFSTSSDIDGLLNGSTFGSLWEGGFQGHTVVGLRDNDVGDTFSIVSGGGNWNTDQTYDTVILSANAGGNVGIGTTNPTAKLQVEGGPIRAMGPIEQAAQGYDRIDFGVQDGTPRMAFDNAESPTVWLIDSETDGTFRWFVPGVVKMRLMQNGNLQIAGAYQNLSDARLKKDVRTIPDALATLVRLRGVTFYWKDQDAHDASLQFGLIAQEVEEVLPDLVKTDSEGMKSVNYSGLIGPLIEAVKELKAATDHYATDIDELRSIVEEQGRELERLKAAR